MDITWDICKREDGTFELLNDGSIQLEGVSEAALEKCLDPYGTVGDTYEEVRRQLAENGRARVTIRVPGKAEQA